MTDNLDVMLLFMSSLVAPHGTPKLTRSGSGHDCKMVLKQMKI
jgi:hypothetical protein